MSHSPTLASPAPRGLFGAFRSWLQVASSASSQTSAFLRTKPALPPEHSHGTVRVLVVDDNPENLMVISAMMESRGLIPLLAADGAEAVALACQHPLDFILMDLQMPVLDGLGATSAIRRFEVNSSRPAVPVIAYSSASPGAGVLAKYGLNGSLNKPCRDQELEDCLVQWCPSYRSA